MSLQAVILFFLFGLCNEKAKASTFYVSASDGNDSRTISMAQNASTPWKTLFKLTRTEINPGDSILLKRGDTFHETLNIAWSGTNEKYITISAYGKGPAPIITGFRTLSNWNNYRGSVQFTNLQADEVKIVRVGKKVVAMGRFPDDLYMTYQKHVGNQSIKDEALLGSKNWTGAEVVIRKMRWILDHHTITSQRDNIIYYNSSEDKHNNAYSPVDGNGYFIQNHLGTLSKRGEWYFDRSAQRFYYYYDHPNSKIMVDVGTVAYTATINSKSYININCIDFEGANNAAISMTDCRNIHIERCSFNFSTTGVHAYLSSGIRLERCIISNSLSNGISMEYDVHNVTIQRCTIDSTFLFPGMGLSGDANGIGILVYGDTSKIISNTVRSTGYNAIQFIGTLSLIMDNYIDSFCLSKDDGGGIYCYVGKQKESGSGKIISNVIRRAIGQKKGVEGFAYENYGKSAAIYLDEYSDGIEVKDNLLFEGSWVGLFLHRTGSKNLIFNNMVVGFERPYEYLPVKAKAMEDLINSNIYFKEPKQ